MRYLDYISLYAAVVFVILNKLWTWVTEQTPRYTVVISFIFPDLLVMKAQQTTSAYLEICIQDTYLFYFFFFLFSCGLTTQAVLSHHL